MSDRLAETPIDDLLAREWLSVNRLGGYASGTPIGINTRKYHGLLVAAMSPPVRRMVLLSRVEESIHVDNRSFPLSASEYPDTIHPSGFQNLVAFDHHPFPRWAFQATAGRWRRRSGFFPIAMPSASRTRFWAAAHRRSCTFGRCLPCAAFTS